MAFYAYIHTHPGEYGPVPFYAGKGQKHRASDFSHRTAYHKNVVAKYGRDNIGIAKLDCSTEAVAMDLERGFIKCLRRSGARLVNFTDGGEGLSGHRHSDETKAKMRAAALGRERSEATRAKIRAALTGKPSVWVGRKHTEITKARISAARKGLPSPVKDRPCAAATRARISATKLAKPQVECPLCGLQGRESGAMTRYHFDNCKRKRPHDASVS